MALNKFIKSTGIYFIGNVLSKIVVFLLLPIYTSYIPPEAMGLYDTGVTVITLFASVLFLDIGSVILKFSLEKECDNESVPITNGSLIFIPSCAIYFILVTVCSFFFHYEYLGWIIVYGFTYAFNNAVGYVARALHHNTDYAVAGVIQTVLMVAINIVLLVGIGVDYKSLYISFAVSSLIAEPRFKQAVIKAFVPSTHSILAACSVFKPRAAEPRRANSLFLAKSEPCSSSHSFKSDADFASYSWLISSCKAEKALYNSALSFAGTLCFSSICSIFSA